MSRTVIIKRTSLFPIVTARFRDSNDDFIDLTTASSVTFTLRQQGEEDPLFERRACVIQNAAQGIVQYEWQAGDTDVSGVYIGDFEITWPNDEVEIIPTKGYLVVRVLNAAGDT